MRSVPTYILIIDDDEATNYISRMVIEEAGCCARIEVMEAAAAALEYLQRVNDTTACPETDLPDLIFLDINMPGMNGWEFADEFARLDLRKQIVVVMFSTSVSPKDRERAVAHPAISTFQQKPLTEEALNSVLEKYFINVRSKA